MTGNEQIELGDKLRLTAWRKGLRSFGDMQTVWGITEKYINLSGSDTSWLSRESLDWQDYELIKGNGPTTEILRFQKHMEGVWEANKTHLANAAKRINKQQTTHP